MPTVDLSSGPFTIPAGVSEVSFVCSTGRSGWSDNGAAMSDSGVFRGYGTVGVKITGKLPVVPGDVLTGVKGTDGADGTISVPGAGGSPDGGAGRNGGGGGGGSSTLSKNSVAMVIAGAPGGGGHVANKNYNYSGGGGNPEVAFPQGQGGVTANGYTDNSTAGKTTGVGTDKKGSGSGGYGGGYYRGGSGGVNGGGGAGSSFVSPAVSGVSTGTPYGSGVTISFVVIPPSIPTIIAPTADAGIKPGAVLLQWQHHGPDGQVQADVEWRPVAGGTTPVTVSDGTLSTTVTLASDGDYEWRVRTYGGALVAGPWSAWTPFHVETPPADPVITAPTPAQLVTTVTTPIGWASSGQQAFEARLVDGATVVWSSGQTAGAATSVVATTVDNANLDVQVRIRGAYVWTDWVSVTFTTDWVAPVAPEPFATADDPHGCIRIGWIQPATVEPVEVYRVEVTEAGARRVVARQVDSSAREFVYWIPLSGVDTAIHVLAVAASGAFSEGTTGWSTP